MLRHYSVGRFRAGLRAFVLGRVAQGLATLLLLLAAVRWLTPADYGTYMLIWGLCEVAVPLTSLGLLPAVQQFLPRLVAESDSASVRRFVRVMEMARYVVMAMAGGVLALGWPWLAEWVGLPAGPPIPGWLLAVLMFAVLGARFAAELLESLLEQRDAQLVRALQPIGRLVGLSALWALNWPGLVPLILADVTVSIAALVLGQVLLTRRIRVLSALGSGLIDWSEVRAFVAHLSISQVLTAAGDAGAVRLAVTRALGVEAAGLFAFLQQLLATLNRYLPSLLVANIVRPMLVARHAEGDHSSVGTGIALLVKLNLIVVLGALGVVCAGGDELVHFASGREAAGSGLALGLLVLGLMSLATSQVAMLALQIHRRPASVSLASLLAPTSLLMGWLGALSGGLTGAAVGVATSMWLRGLVSVLMLQRSPDRAPLDWVGIRRLLLWAAFLGICSAATRPWLGGVLAAGLFMMTFAIVLAWRSPLSGAELDLAVRGLGRRAAWLHRWSRS